jgi:hypothetical protein
MWLTLFPWKATPTKSPTSYSRWPVSRGMLNRAIEHYWEMEILCAECGCLVERGFVVMRCGTSDCCCAHLPDVDRHVAEDVAK